MSTSFWPRPRFLAAIDAALAKPDPDNVSVVGPRGIGKTALLREVARTHAKGRGGVLTACYVDLRHRRPGFDHAVYGPIADALAQSLRALGNDNEFSLLADDINPEADGKRLFTKLRRMTIDDFKPTGKAVLLVLDGCDEVLKSTVAPGDTWDGLCNLADEGGVRFITGSRRRLGELCRDDDKGSSDFHLRFQQLLELDPFRADEWAGIFAAWGAVPAQGVRDTCHEWTGGYPSLVAALARRLVLPGPVTVGQVASEGGRMVSQRDDTLLDLWDDLGVEVQADLRLIAGSTVKAADVGGERRRALDRFGLVRPSGDALKISSQAMQMFAMEQGSAAGELHRLFGTRDAYVSNIGKVLTFRAAQVGTKDPALREYLRRIFADIERPGDCLYQFRALANRALDIVLQKEAPGASFPAAWVGTWMKNGNTRWPGKGFPAGDRGRQCQLLWEIIDDSIGQCLAKHVSRRTVALVEQVKGYGDLGQHQDSSIDGGIAIAAAFAAVEMCESLQRDVS